VCLMFLFFKYKRHLHESTSQIVSTAWLELAFRQRRSFFQTHTRAWCWMRRNWLSQLTSRKPPTTNAEPSR